MVKCKQYGTIDWFIGILFVLLLFLIGCLFERYVFQQRLIKKYKKMKMTMIVRCYNGEGGFFWHIYQVMMASYMARRYSMKIIVHFDTGLYFEHDSEYRRMYQHIVDRPESRHNWFHYYFAPINSHDWQNEQQMIQDLLLSNQIRSFSQFCPENPNLAHRFFEWDRKALELAYGQQYNVHQMYRIDWHQEWIRCCGRIQPQILNRVQEVWNIRDPTMFWIGIHIRLTDKIGNSHGSEDHQVHFEHEWIVSVMRQFEQKAMNELKVQKVGFMIATDEEPCLTHIRSCFHSERLLFTKSIRSQSTTSGLRLRSNLCQDNVPDHLQHPDCVLYRKLADNSIHRGHKHLSSYVKGEDVLVDALLLAKTSWFLASRGNVSNSIVRINPSIVVYDLVSIYHQQHGTSEGFEYKGTH